MNLEQMGDIDLANIADTLIFDWGVNILLALAIFFVGRMVARLISKIIKKVLQKADMDDMLINFIMSIINAVMLLFIIIAALSQLGVDTTSLVALSVRLVWP